MADINAKILRDFNDAPTPQHKVKGQNAFEFSEGSSGALHTKIVDKNGNPLSLIPVADSDVKAGLTDVTAKLTDIEAKQNAILQRLDGTFDTQLTGRNAEEIIYIDAESYTDTSNHFYPHLDLRKYKKIKIFVKNTHDAEVRLDIRSATDYFQHWNETEYVPTNTTVGTTPENGFRDITGELPISDMTINRFNIRTSALSVPTTGALTVIVWGVPN